MQGMKVMAAAASAASSAGATSALGYLTFALCIVTALAGAVYEQKKPIFSNPDDYKIMFEETTSPGSPVNIKIDNTPFNATANQMRVVAYQKCGAVALHFHPRGNEQNYVVKGAVKVGMFLENGTHMEVVVKAGQGLTVPQGTIHYGVNVACYPTELLVMSDYPDPGVVYIAEALLGFPEDYLKAALKGPLPSGTNGNILSYKNCACDKQYGTGN